MSGTALKYIMMFLMVLDHIPYFVSHELWLVFHLISRCVAPFFAYMAVEGFVHTSNRIKYIRRLFLWAALMFLGNSIINKLIVRQAEYAVKNNIFFTFAIGVFALYTFERLPKISDASKSFFLFFSAIAAIFIAFIYAEGGIIILPFMLISYYFRENKKLRNTFYCVLAAFAFVVLFFPLQGRKIGLIDVLEKSDFLFISFLPFTYLYNGKRGESRIFGERFIKYSFYVFYPLHLWLIALLAWQMEL